MHTDELLHLLRERLRLVNERLAERERQAQRGANYALHADGARVELRSERDFLTYLINESTHRDRQL